MSYEMIKIEGGFQYSVNIAYDLHNENKLKSFIPTKSSLKLLEDILFSTNPTSNDRSRVLVGAYGKGKSHIVLSILSLLSGTSIEKFEKLKNKISASEHEKLRRAIQNYSESETKLLPVLITGTGNSISQNFLLALQRTLKENDLLDLMPETNFKAAVKTIERWKAEYPATFLQFENEIIENTEIQSVEKLLLLLNDFDNASYKIFEGIYPKLTSGSVFNPFLGFDVVEIYESVVKSLKEKTDYSGVYVVYDEFSKYLESNISDTSVNDTKMLQDFAEKCNRSAENQMHLMLICHKEISNYIDNLPKQKVDGWRGISNRFTHIHLNNNFSQTYEIIESVIVKDGKLFSDFLDKNKESFDSLVELYSKNSAFNDLKKEDLKKTFTGCYPLHPLSIYILPRLSERVAQNERTLFTFLSSPNANGLVQWLKQNVISSRVEKSYEKDASTVVGMTKLLTPDLLYDYFEPLFKKEIYTEDLYKTYTLTTILLDKLDSTSLEAKIVKLLSLIYMLSQFERLSPMSDTIHNAFNASYSAAEIEGALKNLIEKECIVYLRRSNNFYSLKQSSGLDINSEIQKMMAAQNSKFSLKDVLNACNFDKALYPLRYNDEKEMTRYFDFVFVYDYEILENKDWKGDLKTNADGIVYAVLLSKNAGKKEIQEILKNEKEAAGKCVFIVPKKSATIEQYAKEYNAVVELLKSCGDDNILRDEYEVILDDLQAVINDFISIYTRAENQESVYFYRGIELAIKRKADLTEKLSEICDEYFSDTPIIINESVNKNEISTASYNARNKIISALLRGDLEKNLGLSGGQELAIMRSLLSKTGVVTTENENPKINFNVADDNLAKVLNLIKDFVVGSKGGKKPFSKLYEELTSDKNKIGLRKGVIPVYLACVFHEYKKQIILYSGDNEINISTDAICLLNERPEYFSVGFMDWGADEEKYVEELSKLFSNYILESEKTFNACDFVFNAMRRWYMDLPKYAKEMKVSISGEAVNPDYLKFLKNLKISKNGRDFIFEKLRNDFNNIEELANAKRFFDTASNVALELFSEKVRAIFDSTGTLHEALKSWSDKLKGHVFDTVFDNGTTRFLKLCKTENSSDISLSRQIAFISTDLNIEDWNDATIEAALKNIKIFKERAETESENENNTQEIKNATANLGNAYEINFVSKSGTGKTKRFEKSEISPRGKILSHSLKNAIDGMGLSISDGEKRQVLMDLLIDLCGGE